MAHLAILNREFDIAPYKLSSMIKAAPFIDRINAAAGAATTIADLAATLGDFIAVLAIALVKIDPALTAEHLEEELGIGDLPAIRDAFIDIIQESGMKAPANDVEGAAADIPALAVS